MRQILPDVWQTRTESPFPGLTTHAYLLTRDSGNILFYNTCHVDEIAAMADLGGVAYQFLSHQDEIGDGLIAIHDRHGAKLVGNTAEVESYQRVRVPDILIEGRQLVLDVVEAIPTPGHTPGSTCYLVTAKGGACYLFTGDTIYRNTKGGWTAGFIEGHSELAPLLDSLHLLAGLEPGVVLSSAFAGEAGFEVMETGAWRRHVMRAIERLEQKGAG